MTARENLEKHFEYLNSPGMRCRNPTVWGQVSSICRLLADEIDKLKSDTTPTGDGVRTCPSCKGRGLIVLGGDLMGSVGDCPKCGGSGRIEPTPITEAMIEAGAGVSLTGKTRREFAEEVYKAMEAAK